ncbi:MAG: XdhC family protein [Chloroflexota bacterium]
MADDHQAVYEAVVEATKKAIPAALVTVISTTGSMPRHAGSKMLVYSDGRIVGTVGGGAMEARVIAVAQETIQNGNATTEKYTLNSIDAGDPGICGGSATLFIEPIAIPATLLVIGGGHVGQALAELGKWMGYRVILSDDRIAYCNEDVISGLDDYIVSAPADIPQKLAITPQTYVAAVTRGLPVDETLIPALLETEAGYIGLIGSRRRWAITAKVLREKHGITEAQLERIHAPIGLELEAESPKEIALSILAEITMVRRGGTGKPMQWLGRIDETQ